MKPANLATKIFLDGGDAKETRRIKALLGFLDGQTTNPTLISKNPEAKARLEKGEKFTNEELLGFYKGIVKEISGIIQDGSVSIEVYADESTSAEEMLNQGRTMFSWIPNAHIKFPITPQGLEAADLAVQEGMRVNMTLCFSQEQAAAVYAATKGAKPGQVFVSPFVGRLDDRGERGMDLTRNIIDMYSRGDGHVQVLTASVRNINHLLYAIHLGSDIITAPANILEEWTVQGLRLPEGDFTYQQENLSPIAYKEIDLSRSWQEYNIKHLLTDHGLARFAQDWNVLLTPTH